MQNKSTTLSSGIAFIIVLAIYTLFINLGPRPSRGYTSDYYSRLATSFKHGQLALEEKPDPALLALSNPYDQKARKNIPVVGDASLYKGKYYLYFGPFPSLVLALIAGVLPVRPGDQIFLYLFVAGLFVVQSFLFLRITRNFYPNLPGWMLPLGILILGLTGPYTRMLAHPFIHEAAVAGGQLLFMAGFLSAFLAFEETSIHPGRYLLAGICWAGAISTRYTQLLPAGCMVALTCLFLLARYRLSGLGIEAWRSILALTAPLAVCAISLAWYNWARFGSIFQTGLYYQLAGFNLQANFPILFSNVYLIQNLYNYFLNPFEIKNVFPFVFPKLGSEISVVPSIQLPTLYAVEGKFAGALISTPFLLFASLPAFRLVKGFTGILFRRQRQTLFFDLYNWTVLGLFGSFLAGCLLISLYYYVGFRFEAEFVSSLALLALIGFCLGYTALTDTTAQKVYTILGTSLALFSILVNISLAYTGVRA